MIDDVTGKGISFDEWGGVDQYAARRMALDSEIKPLRIRVMFAAIGWSNLIGHAEFDPAGLCHALQTADPKTGELHIPGRKQVSNAIREARDLGLVGAGSTVECLVAPPWWHKSGGRGGKTCAFHRIRARHGSRVKERASDTGAVSPRHGSRVTTSR